MLAEYDQTPRGIITFNRKEIYSFLNNNAKDIDIKTVESFGEEWSKFDDFSPSEIEQIGNEYFDIIPQELLNGQSYILDVGCGSGRWSKYLSNKVGAIECIDPSKAIFTAAQLLRKESNIRITQASVGNIPFPDNTFDLVMSIGVLHHVPNTQESIIQCVNKIKEGGFFFVYLYYDLSNRGLLFKSLFYGVNIIRKVVSKLPSNFKKLTCDIIAFIVYLPLIFFAGLVKKIFGKLYVKLPLSYYVGKSINVIRNDALDRFGTPLEKRFSKVEITKMLRTAGLTNIQFSSNSPYWHVIGQKK